MDDIPLDLNDVLLGISLGVTDGLKDFFPLGAEEGAADGKVLGLFDGLELGYKEGAIDVNILGVNDGALM